MDQNMKPSETDDQNQAKTNPKINEDWLAVALAFLLIALAAIGVIGQQGIAVKF